MEPTGDRADGNILPANRIDKAIGWIVGGLILLFVVMLAMAGLGRVEKLSSPGSASDTVVRLRALPEVEPTDQSEIGAIPEANPQP
jgi:hypothetical protein